MSSQDDKKNFEEFMVDEEDPYWIESNKRKVYVGGMFIFWVI